MSRILRETALWAGAVLGLLAVVAGVAVTCFGFSFLVFRSGSMSPAIPTGSLALARSTPAADLRVGDVVSVPFEGDRVTHRIVSVTLRGDEASLVLQGDANGVPDNTIYVVTGAEREIASVPRAGYAVAYLLSPPGLIVAVCLSGMLLVLGFGSGSASGTPSGPAAPTGGRHRGTRTGARRGAAAVVLVVAGAGGAVGVQGTSAYFTDDAAADTATFTAGTAAPPTAVRCATVGGGDYIVWTAPTGATPTGYVLNWSYNGGTGAVAYGPGVTQGRPPAPGLFGNRAYTATVTALYGSWSATSTTTGSIRGQNVVLGTTWSC